MRKYKLIKETNTRTGREQFIIQSRFFVFFWTDIFISGNLATTYKVFIQLTNPKPKGKYKREEVAIDNVYI